MTYALEEKVALVTGASRGLGRTIAEELAGYGCKVWIHYNNREEEALRTLASIEEKGGVGGVCPFDVRDSGAVQQAIHEILQEDKQVDILVNNAGICRDTLFPLMKTNDWRDVIDVNLHGAYHCCRAVTRPMLRQKKGVIINVSSVAGLHGRSGQTNYATSKGALLSFTRTLAYELAPKGIRVNAVVPGFLNTGMALRMNHSAARSERERIPLRRFGEAKEVAEAVAFLASERASYIVGQTLVIDGGLSL